MTVSANWVSVLSDCLAGFEREQVGSTCPVVDHEIVRGSGTAEDATVWLVCRTRAEQRQFSDSELARARAALRRRMIAAAFPESIVDSIHFRVTSREEVAQRGGFAAL